MYTVSIAHHWTVDFYEMTEKELVPWTACVSDIHIGIVAVFFNILFTNYHLLGWFPWWVNNEKQKVKGKGNETRITIEGELITP